MTSILHTGRSANECVDGTLWQTAGHKSVTLHHAQHSSTHLNSVLCIVWHYIQYCVNNTKKVSEIHAVFFLCRHRRLNDL